MYIYFYIIHVYSISTHKTQDGVCECLNGQKQSSVSEHMRQKINQNLRWWVYKIFPLKYLIIFTIMNMKERAHTHTHEWIEIAWGAEGGGTTERKEEKEEREILTGTGLKEGGKIGEGKDGWRESEGKKGVMEGGSVL